jgi:hypothetical protein
MNEGEFESSYFDSEHDRCYCKACDVRPVLPDVLAHVGGANYEIPGCGLKLLRVQAERHGSVCRFLSRALSRALSLAV